MKLELVNRASRPYVARRSTVSPDDVGKAIEAAMPFLRRFLEEMGAEPVPPPFVRYLRCVPPSALTIEVGVPLSARVPVDDPELVAGFLPSGQYAVAVHVGPPDSLASAFETFSTLARDQGIHLAGRCRETDEVWSGRFEFLSSDPESEPDRNAWQTEIACLVE